MKYKFLILCLLIQAPFVAAQKGQFMTAVEFQNRNFEEPTSWSTLWVTQNVRDEMSKILGRKQSALRIRYWGQGNKTAWIFEEIGKELPITIGIAIENNQIADVSVLEYRESRGGEIRYPFFTEQFLGLTLKGNDHRLSDSVDGITGATLSVRAMKKISRVALYCHTLTPYALKLASE